jgi:hypothetical protein
VWTYLREKGSNRARSCATRPYFNVGVVNSAVVNRSTPLSVAVAVSTADLCVSMRRAPIVRNTYVYRRKIGDGVEVDFMRVFGNYFDFG